MAVGPWASLPGVQQSRVPGGKMWGGGLKGWGGPGPMGYRLLSGCLLSNPLQGREAPDTQQGHGTQAGAANRPGRSVPEKQAEQAPEEGSPRVGGKRSGSRDWRGAVAPSSVFCDPLLWAPRHGNLPQPRGALLAEPGPGAAFWGTSGGPGGGRHLGNTGRDPARPRDRRSLGVRATPTPSWRRFPALLEL